VSTYLYGIIRNPRQGPGDSGAATKSRPWGRGVGEPPARVELLKYDDLAALVSTVDERDIGEAVGVPGMRRDMAAHSDVLNRTIAAMTVLPVRFGVVFPDDDALEDHLLEPQYERLQQYLTRLDGTVELTVRAAYVEDEVLGEVVREQPRLARGLQAGSRRQTGASREARIDLGRRIADAVRAKRDADHRWLVKRLAPLARDVAVAAPASEMAVLNASFLVERSALDRFDRALEKVNAEVAKVMQLTCVGPLPPYSFAAIPLPAAGNVRREPIGR